MLLNKKDIPKQFMGMYYAGMINLVAAGFNTAIYHFGGTWVSLVCALVSLAAGVTIHLVIKHKVQAMLWAKISTV